jgi:hypothetical protein
MILASILVLLAAYVAVMNIIGCASATKEHGYSCVPLISLLFCIFAYSYGGEVLGVWLFLPALVDPGTWVLLLAPCYVIYLKWFAKDSP